MTGISSKGKASEIEIELGFSVQLGRRWGRIKIIKVGQHQDDDIDEIAVHEREGKSRQVIKELVGVGAPFSFSFLQKLKKKILR